MDLFLLQKIGAAAALGILIGLERERRFRLLDSDRSFFGGIRTFGLLSLSGALAALLEDYFSGAFLLFSAGFFLLLIAAYILISKDDKRVGITSEISAVLTYVVGVFAALGQFIFAVVLALIVLSLLHFKDPLHKLAKLIENKEIVSTIQFLIVTAVILPLLPNQDFGPFGFFNPSEVWLMVILISSISFVSYLVAKFMGSRRGILLTGFLAGLVSSTALTLSFADQSKRYKKIIYPFVAGVVIAGTAMFFRVLLEVAVVNPDLLVDLLFPMLLMGGLGVLASLYLVKKTKFSKGISSEEILSQVESPFSLKPALKFGVFYSFIVFLSEFTLSTFGSRGVLATSFFSGFMDVDAITLKLSKMAGNGEINSALAVTSIVIAALVNTTAKGVMFYIFGNRKAAKKLALVFSILIIAGASSVFLLEIF